MNYTVMDHTADLGIEIGAETLPALFQQASLAMFDLICDLKEISGTEKKSISILGDDTEELMINLLRELLYLWSVKHFLVDEIEIVDLSDKKISATLSYETFDKKRHQINTEIKAVTYHMLEIKKETDGWLARVIFDV